MTREKMLMKRLGKAEKTLMRIDSLFNNSERPCQIIAEYFEEINSWWFDEPKSNQGENSEGVY